jgi:hypothetical protein
VYSSDFPKVMNHKCGRMHPFHQQKHVDYDWSARLKGPFEDLQPSSSDYFEVIHPHLLSSTLRGRSHSDFLQYASSYSSSGCGCASTAKWGWNECKSSLRNHFEEVLIIGYSQSSSKSFKGLQSSLACNSL